MECFAAIDKFSITKGFLGEGLVLYPILHKDESSFRERPT